MELLQLRYFCALAESQHLTRTASDLMISPPSLSLTISKLEKELGLPLFDRVKRNIRLNNNGEIFYKKIKESLELIDTATNEMAQIRQRTENSISVALTSPMIWNDFFQEFRSAFPEITLITTVVNLDTLNSKDFPFDFFMGNGWDFTSGEWNSRQIGKYEQSLLLVSKSHPFSARKTITVDELKDETFITLGETNPTTDHFVLKLCESYGFHPKKIIQANYFTRICYLKNNDGVVLTSNLGVAKNFIDDGTIQKIRIKDTKLRRYQAIAWRKNKIHSPAAKKFLNTVLDYFPNTNENNFLSNNQ